MTRRLQGECLKIKRSALEQLKKIFFVVWLIGRKERRSRSEKEYM